MVTYIEVCDKFLRDSGSRIPAENVTFLDRWETFKVDMPVVWERCQKTYKKLQNSVNILK